MSLWQVNPVRTKELTNIRAPGKDENVRLSPPRLVCSVSATPDRVDCPLCIDQPCKFLCPLLQYESDTRFTLIQVWDLMRGKLMFDAFISLFGEKCRIVLFWHPLKEFLATTQSLQKLLNHADDLGRGNWICCCRWAHWGYSQGHTASEEVLGFQ